MKHAIELARARALSEQALDNASKAMITTNAPKVGYYRLAGDYAQYGFAWKITTNRTMSVFGEGDIRKLEGAKISITEDHNGKSR